MSTGSRPVWTTGQPGQGQLHDDPDCSALAMGPDPEVRYRCDPDEWDCCPRCSDGSGRDLDEDDDEVCQGSPDVGWAVLHRCEHLTVEDFEKLGEFARNQIAGPHSADGDRERWCPECRARITIGTDGTTEYGHYGTCSRSIDRESPFSGSIDEHVREASPR